jgi:hypothetical protein
MDDWHSRLLDRTKFAVEGDPFWCDYLEQAMDGTETQRVLHLAIFAQPYLRFILEGKKTVESRFSRNLCPPHRRVHRGDVLLLKESGTFIHGLCCVSDVWFYELDPTSWDVIRTHFAKAMCADGSEFWTRRESASFVTLMKLTHVIRTEPIPCEKRDRRGWVVLRSRRDGVLYEG